MKPLALVLTILVQHLSVLSPAIATNREEPEWWEIIPGTYEITHCESDSKPVWNAQSNYHLIRIREFSNAASSKDLYIHLFSRFEEFPEATWKILRINQGPFKENNPRFKSIEHNSYANGNTLFNEIYWRDHYTAGDDFLELHRKGKNKLELRMRKFIESTLQQFDETCQLSR